ncbi:hypothetical protein HZS_1566 [Henneguya salminicola]|nr:hypothetical protein HZS_1566 [Henneguya salminicola]
MEYVRSKENILTPEKAETYNSIIFFYPFLVSLAPHWEQLEDLNSLVSVFIETLSFNIKFIKK